MTLKEFEIENGGLLVNFSRF